MIQGTFLLYMSIRHILISLAAVQNQLRKFDAALAEILEVLEAV